jgi:hypothetical protein
MSDISFKRKLILTIGALVIIVPLTAVFGKFAFCKYLCWQVPFMIIGLKISDLFKLNGLSLKADNSKCDSCEVCILNYPMNLDVMENVKNGQMKTILCMK